MSNQWKYDTPLSLGNWKATAAVDYDPAVLLKSPKAVSLYGSVPGAENILLTYMMLRDFAAQKSLLTFKSVMNSVALTAHLAGETFPDELMKLTASQTVVARGVKVLAEPSFAIKAKTAALKLVAQRGAAALTVEWDEAGALNVLYSVRFTSPQPPPPPVRHRSAISLSASV